MQLLCSTGAFSRYPDYVDYRATLEYGPQLDVDGFELMFYPSWHAQIETIAAALQRSGLKFPVIHTEKNIGVALGSAEAEKRAEGVQMLAVNCHLGRLLGTKTLVLHLWGWPELDDHLEYNLASLIACLDIATQHGLELAIETIPCRKADPLSNIYRALQCDARSRVALDTEFLANHQQLEEVFTAPWLWQEARVRHVHIKDFDGQPFTPAGGRRYLHPGEGHIDFVRFFAELRQHSFTDTISLEASAINSEGVVDIGKLNESLHTLRTLIK